MAGPKKKKVVEDTTTGQENSAHEGMDIDTTFLADFEGANPTSYDFDGIKQLLKQLFLKAHINLGQLTDMVIQQQGLGSVLKQSLDDDDYDDEDDEDLNTVFGVTTVINLTSNKENECVSQILQLVSEFASSFCPEAKETVDKILNNENNKIGLLLNERFINIPCKIADPLLSTLQQELLRTAKKQPNYQFDYFLMICKVHKMISKDKKEEEIVFVNPEEEVFAKESDVSVEVNVLNESSYGVAGTWTKEDKQLIPYRKILLIKANKFDEIVQEIKTLVA